MRVAKIKKIATSAKNDPVSKALNDTNKIVDNLRLAHSTLENGCSTYVIRKMIADGEELEKNVRNFTKFIFVTWRTFLDWLINTPFLTLVL